ncbi:hypothetical protein D8796_04885 [Streptococcus cristatus]|uniref:Uncharacterized protein n=1 Tax=Streptococcus cristatus TaxID=45634 RepID=A0A3R9LSC7_STRCR|nr:hypothetical protein [Streptococcus cristatus]RSJ79210.1 hypothetical protein D8795_05890 [Streptococcus cristatus]RSJ80282.1 hypothetical protein D8796_04885 [Streptococcus cristatus]RSJ85340.1 hypothetical protein D8793_06910 [Streptococcus cristatus]RSJ86063.1 hypothetical protein D8794_04955 [Streptococcus cristatus]
MEQIFRLEEKYKQELKKIEQVEEALDSMRLDARRKTDLLSDQLLYYSRDHLTDEIYLALSKMNDNMEQFDLSVKKSFDALSEEREEVTAKYRKDLERLEEEYYKRKKAENSQI